ncbi:galactocerebrosidase, partial [Biomphalaria glabrata]
MILRRLTSLEKVVRPLKITVHVMLQMEEDAGPAHTTQFTSIGWKYLNHDSGIGKLPKSGSYAGLISPDGTDLTIVIETITHDHSICLGPGIPWYDVHPQLVTLNLKGSLFVSDQAVLKLGLDEVYKLTTTSTGQKESYTDPLPPNHFLCLILMTLK